MTREDTFVLIVGGGPVGLTLALKLGLSNVPTILVSQNSETSTHPKCDYLNIRTMEHLRRLGMADEIRAAAHTGDFPSRLAFRTRYCGYEFGAVDLPFAIGESLSPETAQNISQIVIEPLLKGHAERQDSVDLRFAWRMTDIAIDDDGAEVGVECLATGEQRLVAARYVVGCDGAQSAVREAMGANLVGKDGFVQRNFLSPTKISYFIESKELQTRSGHARASLIWIMNEDARGLVTAHDGQDRYVVHYQLPQGTDWEKVNSDEVLRQLFGGEISYRILSREPWEGGIAKVSDQYRKGAVFLAGDAAHHFTPFGGFGMNTGIGDAINIGWKLAAIHQGWGGFGLLDSYALERQEIAIRNSLIGIYSSDRKDRWNIPDDLEQDTPEAEAHRRDFGCLVARDGEEEYQMMGAQLGERYASPIIAETPDIPDVDPWDRYSPSDEPGARLPHITMDDGTPLFDALGPGLSLIAFEGADVAGFVKAAADSSTPLKIIEVGVRNIYFENLLVLVRPDHHIAWSGDPLLSDPTEILDIARGVIA